MTTTDVQAGVDVESGAEGPGKRRYYPGVKLNGPLVLALSWGAGIRSTEALAARVGIDKSQLGRALRGVTSPSVRMIDGIVRAFPAVPYQRLFVPADTPDGELAAAVGMSVQEVADGWAAADGAAP